MFQNLIYFHTILSQNMCDSLKILLILNITVKVGLVFVSVDAVVLMSQILSFDWLLLVEL